MSRSILIDDLRARGRQQVENLWEAARQEIAELQTELARKTSEEEARCDLAARQAHQNIRRKKMVAAQRQASAIITRAEQEFYDRLYGLSLKLMPRLWPGSREELLRRLAAEIPEAPWQKVRVNPADASAARKVFPDSIIEEDPEILGGLEVLAEKARTRIINTLTKRLDKAWSWLGPEILHEVAADGKAD